MERNSSTCNIGLWSICERQIESHHRKKRFIR